MKGVFVLIILAVLAISGCTQEGSNMDLQNVDLKLKWVHQAQFAGNYIAKEKGFYENEGLSVNIIPFTFEKPTIDAVINGEVTFGITGGDELLLARENGIPIKAFAVIYKINPVCAYSLTENEIKKPQDFIGKTIGLERAADGTEINIGVLYAAMMSKLGINRSLINEVTIGYDATELLAGETDVSTGYIINEPHQAMEAGYEVRTILMADYGVNMYADVLFATEDTINNRPEIVQKFLSATLDGWQYAIENEEDSVNTVLKYATDRTKNHETYMLRSSIPLIHVANEPLGLMKRSEWINAQNILLEQGIMNAEVNIEDVFTNKFVEAYYNSQ